MDLILGMDLWVFAAWILTIIAAISCIIYGLYYEFFNKSAEDKKQKSKELEVK